MGGVRLQFPMRMILCVCTLADVSLVPLPCGVKRLFPLPLKSKMPRTNYVVVTSSIRPEWRQYIRL